MKFSVGYPQYNHPEFISSILQNPTHIAEVYFSFGGIPNGRSPLFIDESKYEAQSRILSDLDRINEVGIALNLLLNANCYGEESLSRVFFENIGDTVDFLSGKYNLTSVTTTSPLIGKFIHANFEDIKVRASVNMAIASPFAADTLKDYFDGFYLKREYNRNFKELRKFRKWCDENSKKMYILANSGCVNECPAHTFHDNLVAHEAEIVKFDNAYSFSGICRDYLKTDSNRSSIVRDMNYIRPEDTYLYEGLCDSMKLATRTNPHPAVILDAYISKCYRGAVTDLLEPDNGSAMLPMIVDNSKFPNDFGEKVMNCLKNCDECGYCEKVFENAKVILDNI